MSELIKLNTRSVILSYVNYTPYKIKEINLNPFCQSSILFYTVSAVHKSSCYSTSSPTSVLLDFKTVVILIVCSDISFCFLICISQMHQLAGDDDKHISVVLIGHLYVFLCGKSLFSPTDTYTFFLTISYNLFC